MRLTIPAAALLAAAGCWQAGQGAWIYLKAELAQVLMARAWDETRKSGRPTRPWHWADTWPVARLAAPGHGIAHIVLNGDTGNVLAFGPGLVPGSAEPGLGGRVVISGHRDTHFRYLEQLAPGDELLLEPAGGAAVRYRVSGNRVFDIRTPGPRPYPLDPGLSLVTCYPFDAVVPGGPLRYLVNARPVAAGA